MIVSLALASCGPRLDAKEVAQGRRIAAGDQAPDFTLASSEGDEVSLEDLRGRPVVLYFYPKDETPGCTKQACSFRDNMEEFEKLDATVLGISLDTTESHEKFKKSHRLNFPLLSDPGGRAVTAYGAWKARSKRLSAFSIDRSTFVIDTEGVIRRIWRDVDVAGHADEVLAFVKTI
ncbi:MAG: peroxiredoxin [Deltaproteobacteria bacterium]|nr:peroxiredoxin [Deltaproteobacteria bacterium]